MAWLFRKTSNIPVHPFYGFPADGVWIVKNGGTDTRLVMKLPDVPIEAEKLSKIARMKGRLVEIMLNNIPDGPFSIYSFVHHFADKIVEEFMGNE